MITQTKVIDCGCPLLAISRHEAGSSRTSALPPKADIGGANGNKIIAEFTEVESGKRCDRHELNEA